MNKYKVFTGFTCLLCLCVTNANAGTLTISKDVMKGCIFNNTNMSFKECIFKRGNFTPAPTEPSEPEVPAVEPPTPEPEISPVEPPAPEEPTTPEPEVPAVEPPTPEEPTTPEPEVPPVDNYTPKKFHGGWGPKDKYNKYFPTSGPLFDFYESHLIQNCEDVGHWYQSPKYPNYKYCICDNGGQFNGTRCSCDIGGGWEANNKCFCPIGTEKYVFKTGPEENIDVFNCRSLDHVNSWTFSKPEDWQQRPYFRNDLNNENAEDEFWESLTQEQRELLIHWPRLPGYEELAAYRKTLIRDDIWKAWGITATKGSQTIKFDVIGTSRCIDGFANLDVDHGSECVCSILSVSKGTTTKFWVYNPSAHFYVGLYAGMPDDQICESECAKACGREFYSNEYKLRHILLNWWSPN